MKRSLSLCLVFCLLFTVLFGCDFSVPEEALQQKKPLFYLKSGSLYSMGPDDQPIQIVDRFPSDNSYETPFWRADVAAVLSPSAGYLAYSLQENENDDFRTLFVANTKKNDVRLVSSHIPSELLSQVGPDIPRYYCFSDTRDALYFLQYNTEEIRTDLCVYEDGRISVVKENVIDFMFSRDEKTILCVSPTLSGKGVPETGSPLTKLKQKYDYNIKQLSLISSSATKEQVLSIQMVDWPMVIEQDFLSVIQFAEENPLGERSFKEYVKDQGVFTKELELAGEESAYITLLQLKDGAAIVANDQAYYYQPADKDEEVQEICKRQELVKNQNTLISAQFLVSDSQKTLYYSKSYSGSNKEKLYQAPIQNGKLGESVLIDSGEYLDFSPADGSMGVLYRKTEKNTQGKSQDNVYYYKNKRQGPVFLGEGFNIFSSICVWDRLYLSRKTGDSIDYYRIKGTIPVLYQDKVDGVLTCNNQLYTLRKNGDSYDVYLEGRRVVLKAQRVIQSLGTGCFEYSDLFLGL